jgi:hypothetical protein
MYGGMREPQLCSVDGHAIRQLIEAYLVQARLAIASFREAERTKRAGYDWARVVEDAESEVRAFEWTLPVVADGPFIMSITEWVTLRNKFQPIRNADQVLEAKKKHEERQAAQTKPEGGAQ